jgi:hypothetical protein
LCTYTDTKAAAKPLALIKSFKEQLHHTKNHIVCKFKRFFDAKGHAREQEAAQKLRKQAKSLLDMQDFETQDVTVVVRIRPLSVAGPEEGRIRALEKRGASVALHNSCRYTAYRADEHDSWGAPRVFTFDAVMPESSKTEDTFSLIGASAVMEVCRGVDAVVFAFGQTGSGKTYTLLGDSEDATAHGVATMTFAHLQRELDKQKGPGTFAFNIQVSAVQIYLNHVYDLLSEDEAVLRIRTLQIEKTLSQVGGELCELEPKETSKACNNVGEFQLILQDIASKRMQNKTNMNDKSSRSHLILTLTVRRTVLTLSGAKGNNNSENRNSEGDIVSKLFLVDLAGNERDLARKGLSDEAGRKQEGIDINLSLSALSTCLRERAACSAKAHKCGNHKRKQSNLGNTDETLAGLSHKSATGLYRRSALTRLLRQQLMGAKIFFLACCSPAAPSAATTGHTLEYAAIVKRIKTKAEDTALLLEQSLDKFPIEFLPYKALVDCTRIARSHEGKTVYLYELRIAVVRVMVSHRWLSPSFDPHCAHPDDQENHKLALLRELFGRLCANGWISSSDQLDVVCWIDYGEFGCVFLLIHQVCTCNLVSCWCQNFA